MSHRDSVLEIVLTDRTFECVDYKARVVWMGKCLHCNAHLFIELSGEPISRATIDHIFPRTAGGDDDPRNLGLACAGCNAEKGIRHDRRTRVSERSADLVEKLLQKRLKRWREPE